MDMRLFGVVEGLSFLMVACCLQFYVVHFLHVSALEYVPREASDDFQLLFIKICLSPMACCI
jgi:hypothetical protein